MSPNLDDRPSLVTIDKIFLYALLQSLSVRICFCVHVNELFEKVKNADNRCFLHQNFKD